MSSNNVWLCKIVESFADALQECNHFKAGDKVRSTVSSKKLAVTGVFGSVCKHEIPMKFCDMKHGKR